MIHFGAAHPVPDWSDLHTQRSACATKCSGNEGEARILAAIDEEEDIWEVKALLARWKKGRRSCLPL